MGAGKDPFCALGCANLNLMCSICIYIYTHQFFGPRLIAKLVYSYNNSGLWGYTVSTVRWGYKPINQLITSYNSGASLWCFTSHDVSQDHLWSNPDNPLEKTGDFLRKYHELDKSSTNSPYQCEGYISSIVHNSS